MRTRTNLIHQCHGTPRAVARHFQCLLTMVVAFACFPGAIERGFAQCDPEKSATITASDGYDGQVFGLSMSVSGDVMAVGVPADDDFGTNAGAVYIYRYDGDDWIEEEKISEFVPNAENEFGTAVAISDDLLIVGAPYNSDLADDAGAIYVYQYDAVNGWVPLEQIFSPNGVEGDQFGAALAIDENGTLAVGAAHTDPYGYCAVGCGSIYVFRFSGSSFAYESRIESSDSFRFDYGVGLDISNGNVIAGVFDEITGTDDATLFLNDGQAWNPDSRVHPSGDQPYGFGEAVAISGDHVIVGAPKEFTDDGNYAGAAYLFRRDPVNHRTWIEVARLTEPNGAGLRYYGKSVDISGDLAVVAQGRSDTTAPSSVYLYRRIGDSWMLESTIVFDPHGEESGFGKVVKLSSNRLISTAPHTGETGSYMGSVHVYDLSCQGLGSACLPNGSCVSHITAEHAAEFGASFNGVDTYCDEPGIGCPTPVGPCITANDLCLPGLTAFDCNHVRDGVYFGPDYMCDSIRIPACLTQNAVQIRPDDLHDGESFGWAIASSGDVAVIGAPFDENNQVRQGQAYILERQGAAWKLVQRIESPDPSDQNHFGRSVATNGTSVVVSDIDYSSDRGAVYVYRKVGDTWTYVQRLQEARPNAGDGFGEAIAISDRWLAVSDGLSGTANDVQTFELVGQEWVRRTNINKPDLDARFFGCDLALSGDHLAVGAYGYRFDNESVGAVYTYRFDGEWQFQQQLVAGDRGVSRFLGASLDMSGPLLVAGAPGSEPADTNGAGMVYTFEFGDDLMWHEVEAIPPLDSDLNESRYFGSVVRVVRPDLLAITSTEGRIQGFQSGLCHLVQQTASGWRHLGKFTPLETSDRDNFGKAMDVAGSTLLLGAYGQPDGRAQGTAYVVDLRDCLLAPKCLDLSVDNLVAGEDARFTVSGASNGTVVAVVASPRKGLSVLNGWYGFCATLNIANVSSRSLVTYGVIEDGEFVGTKRVPARLGGETLHFQALQRGTCPKQCVSEVVSRTVQ